MQPQKNSLLNGRVPWLLSWAAVTTQQLEESKTTEGPTEALPVAEKETSPEMGCSGPRSPRVCGRQARKKNFSIDPWGSGPYQLSGSAEGFVCLGGPALYMRDPGKERPPEEERGTPAKTPWGSGSVGHPPAAAHRPCRGPASRHSPGPPLARRSPRRSPVQRCGAVSRHTGVNPTLRAKTPSVGRVPLLHSAVTLKAHAGATEAREVKLKPAILLGLLKDVDAPRVRGPVVGYSTAQPCPSGRPRWAGPGCPGLGESQDEESTSGQVVKLQGIFYVVQVAQHQEVGPDTSHPL